MKRCQCPGELLHLTHLPAFRYDTPAMEPADPGPRVPYPLEGRTFLALVSGGLLSVPLTAEAQQAGKVAQIGSNGLPSSSS